MKYFNELLIEITNFAENVSDLKEKHFSTTVEAQKNKWSRHVKETLDVVSEAECSAHAMLYMHGPIDFYFYEEAKCYIGDLNHVGSEGSESDITTLRIRQCKQINQLSRSPTEI